MHLYFMDMETITNISACFLCPRFYKLLVNGYDVFMVNESQVMFKSFKSKSNVKYALICINEEFCHVWRIDNVK